MRNPHIHCLVSFFIGFLICPLLLDAQEISPRFYHIKENGIKDPVVWTIFQSHDGFIWFGSEKGLFRYDGYDIQKIPLEAAGNTASLQFSVSNILEYPTGTLWLGSANNGLMKWNMRTRESLLFQHIPDDSSSLQDNFITAMVIDSSHLIWVGTPKGLQVLDPQTHLFTTIHSDPNNPESLPAGSIRRLLVDSKGNLWVGSNQEGLSRLKAFKDGKALFYNYKPDAEGEMKFPGPLVFALDENPLGQLWVGLGVGGLVRIDINDPPDKPNFEFIPTQNNVPYAFNDRNVNCIERGPHGLTWIGTQKSLYAHDSQQDRYYAFQHDPDAPFSLGTNRQRHLYLDRQKNLWITMFAGIDLLSPYIHPFETIRYDETISKESPISGSPFAILKDSYENLWIGTNKKGLMVLPADGSEARYFPPGHEASKWKAPDVLDIIEDDEKRLWFATSQGLARLDLADMDMQSMKPQFHFYPYKNHRDPHDTTNGPPIRVIYDLEPDPKGGIWLGTHIGLSYFDKTSGRFSNMIDSTKGYMVQAGNFYYALKRDLKGHLWLGTRQTGLKLLPAGAPYNYRSLIHIRSLADQKNPLNSDFIKTLEIDSTNQLWIGTSAGLVKLDSFNISAQDTVFHFSTIHPDKEWTCNNILTDKKGRIWYNSGNGISFLYPNRSPGFSIEKPDGLVSLGSNLSSHFLDKNGKIFWGTGLGISIFHPDSLRPNLEPPQVRLTRFQLFNKEVGLKTDTENELDFYLKEDISSLEELTLQHHHSVLTFEFAALNYYQSEKNQYAYMMEGFDQEWVYAGKRRDATYTNLDPGTYYFRVKAANNDGIWNEEGCKLKIIIAPPWYRTWWAFVLYGTLLTSILGLFLYARVRKVAREYETQARIERAKSEERESVRKRSSRDFHDEAGNKLTKLSLYTELTKRKAAEDPEMLSFLGHIESNVHELATGMRDFIWVLDPEKDTLADTLNRLKDFGDQLFAHSDTVFSYQVNMEDFKQVPLEIKAKRHLLLIFKEAMNNCLKYAQAEHASLEASMMGSLLRVEFEDDGKGFDLKNEKKGNGLKNMQTRAAEMGGKMTFHASPDHGARIRFEMEITRMGEEG